MIKTLLVSSFAVAAAGAPNVSANATRTTNAQTYKNVSSAKPLRDKQPSRDIDRHCMAETICNLKNRIRWGRGSAWTTDHCQEIADAMIASSDEYKIHPALVLAVAINESDLDDSAERISKKGEVVFAKDGGLMGIRCLLNSKAECTNGLVKGLHWKNVMQPYTNIRLGAAMLAHYRDDGGISHVQERRRGPGGRLEKVTRAVRCRHATHAYWAHYNHGPIYKTDGYARHYPHRVAVLYHALAEALNLAPPEELQSTKLTVRDAGKRVRTADRPVEERYKVLVDEILAAGACRRVAELRPQ